VTASWPGKRTRGSTSGRPIMRLLDLLGRRWVLRILWELRGPPLTFRALRAACSDVSPSVLQSRLDDLRAAGLVALQAGAGYALTERGRTLVPMMRDLGRWAEDWAAGLPSTNK
jgi:DNA-binding HxlR family transcriptional regulator